jgi:hypothetical protein
MYVVVLERIPNDPLLLLRDVRFVLLLWLRRRILVCGRGLCGGRARYVLLLLLKSFVLRVLVLGFGGGGRGPWRIRIRGR